MRPSSGFGDQRIRTCAVARNPHQHRHRDDRLANQRKRNAVSARIRRCASRYSAGGTAVDADAAVREAHSKAGALHASCLRQVAARLGGTAGPRIRDTAPGPARQARGNRKMHAPMRQGRMRPVATISYMREDRAPARRTGPVPARQHGAGQRRRCGQRACAGGAWVCARCWSCACACTCRWLSAANCCWLCSSGTAAACCRST